MGGWTKVLELLALIVEEIGLLAADKRREEPVTIVRPPSSRTATPAGRSTPPRPEPSAPEAQAPRMTGHRQMLMAAMQRGMVRSG